MRPLLTARGRLGHRAPVRFAGWLVAGLALLLAGRARAAATTLGPGQTLTLDQDLTLANGDTLDAEGTAEMPCTIEGQGHSIATVTGWQGSFVLRHCTLHGLGHLADPPNPEPTMTPSTIAVSIDANGASTVLIEGNTFDASGGLSVSALDTTTVQVLRNTVLANSLVAVQKMSDDNAQPAMFFKGYANTQQKVFQGNVILHSRAQFDAVQDWLIGGDAPGQGNVFIGDRAGIYARGNSLRIVGNYIHIPGDLDNWNQVKPLSLIDVGDVIVEHNVIRDGNWLVDVRGGAEVRYNLLGDSHDRPWLILENGDDHQLIHHNVFIRNNHRADVDGVWVLHPQGTKTAEIYNNTFDGGGPCSTKTGPAVVVKAGGFLASLRSNAIFDFAPDLGADTALVRGDVGEPNDPPLPRLGYADYNLFYNPQLVAPVNYALSVAGKQERVDPGFALHDALAGGQVNDQVDPKVAGEAMIPVQFPYDDENISAGTTTVCQILAFYRTLYAPGEGSPLVGAGDPADGAGNNIGAIGGADDHFGRLCANGDVGAPNPDPAIYTCGTGTGGAGGGGGAGAGGMGGMVGKPMVVPGGRGFVCVCEAAAGPTPAGLAGALLLAATMVRRRRAR
jgi:hypothetical protein